jgi:hypothetical protein
VQMAVNLLDAIGCTCLPESFPNRRPEVPERVSVPRSPRDGHLERPAQDITRLLQEASGLNGDHGCIGPFDGSPQGST